MVINWPSFKPLIMKLEDKIRRQLLVCNGQVEVVLTLILTTDTLVGFRDYSELHNTLYVDIHVLCISHTLILVV